MRKRWIFSGVTVLIMAFSYCSHANSSLRYYELINKAELAVCSANMGDAMKLYEQAFAVNPGSHLAKTS